jgi:hypothetical protein
MRVKFTPDLGAKGFRQQVDDEAAHYQQVRV